MDTFVPNMELRKAIITENMIDNLISYLTNDNLADKETLRALADASYTAGLRVKNCK